MEYIRKILKIFKEKKEDHGVVTFRHTMTDDLSVRIITVDYNEEGLIVLSIFTEEQWELVCSMSCVAGLLVEDIIKELVKNKEVTVVIVDPTEFD